MECLVLFSESRLELFKKGRGDWVFLIGMSKSIEVSVEFVGEWFK